jgi:hypothetical protein
MSLYIAQKNPIRQYKQVYREQHVALNPWHVLIQGVTEKKCESCRLGYAGYRNLRINSTETAHIYQIYEYDAE